MQFKFDNVVYNVLYQNSYMMSVSRVHVKMKIHAPKLNVWIISHRYKTAEYLLYFVNLWISAVLRKAQYVHQPTYTDLSDFDLQVKSKFVLTIKSNLSHFYNLFVLHVVSFLLLLASFFNLSSVSKMCVFLIKII